MVRTMLVALLYAAALCGQTTRFLRFVHIQEPQSIMAATVIRSTGEIRDVKVDAQSRAISLSGAQWQMDLAGWLFTRLDHAPTGQHPPMERYEMAGVAEPAVRVFYFGRTQTVASLQELTTLMRSVLKIRRAFTFNAANAAVLRGTPDQIAAAEWLFNELDQRTVAHPASETWQLPDVEEGSIRVFYLRPSLSIPEFMKYATSIRGEVGIRRLFPYNEPRAIAVRGTTEQLSAAERLIRRQVSAPDNL